MELQKPIDVLFPLGGVDSTAGYGSQRPQTASVGVNIRSLDPILERNRGGSRHGLIKFGSQLPTGEHVIQGMGLVVDPRADLLISSFEDFMPDFVVDPSTNNLTAGRIPSGWTSRNPSGRKIPPKGSGSQPSRNRPRATFRRIQVTADQTGPSCGQTVTLTVSLTEQPAGTPVSNGTVRLETIPKRDVDGVEFDGNGDVLFTNVSGTGQFTVTEPTFEGQVIYAAYHTYTPSGASFPATCRGLVSVVWNLNANLSLSSTDGLQLEPGT